MLRSSGSQVGMISGKGDAGRALLASGGWQPGTLRAPHGHSMGPHKTEVQAAVEQSCERGMWDGPRAEWTPDSPEQAQAPAGEPGEGAGVIGQLSHNHLVAGRTTHLHWAVEEGDWLLHIDRLHGN